MKLRPIKIDTYREPIIFLRKDSELCRAQGFQAMSKVEIHADGQLLVGVLNVTDEGLLKKGEVGVCEYAFEKLGLPAGQDVEVRHPEPLRSVQLIRKKINGEPLRREDYERIIQDIVENRYSKVELTAFVVACAQAPLDREEIFYLSDAMVAQGQSLSWGRQMVVDKHCIGGIPGNRTTMIVVPIVAAHGLTIPKTSSRAITSPSGTADTMETLANVDLSLAQMRDIVERENGCLAWGGGFALSPADDIIIRVEKPLSIDAPGQMIASILSKKKAAGSTHVLIDIPVGPTAKIHSYNQAYHLRKLFEYVGHRMGLMVETMITDGSQPIGRGIGPVLEARDIMAILSNDPKAPQDLRKKGLDLAGRVLEFDINIRGGSGRRLAEEILSSGRAYEKMQRIIAGQGPKGPCELGTHVKSAKASRTGTIAGLNNHLFAQCAKLAGAPGDSGAGIDLLTKTGDPVREGQTLFRIHAEEDADLGFAWNFWQRHPEMVEIG